MRDQIIALRDATVHITAPGGGSFISFFMPDGATSLRIYDADYLMEHHFFNYIPWLTPIYLQFDRKNNTSMPRELMKEVGKAFDRYEKISIEYINNVPDFEMDN